MRFIQEPFIQIYPDCNRYRKTVFVTVKGKNESDETRSKYALAGIYEPVIYTCILVLSF